MWIHLLRHGLAVERQDPSAPTDAERPLTDKGRSKTRVAGSGMASMGIRPELLVTSPFVRARQTAEIVIDVLGCKNVETLVSEVLVPTAHPEAFAKLLREHLGSSRPSAILAVGHAPNLDEIIAHLVGADESFTQLKKAGLASLVLRGQTIGYACARLFALYPASVLRRLEPA